MKHIVLLISFLLLSVISLFPQIINVPADQPTIQEGINAASNGDTVLVAEGIYYENIDFKSKAITVASRFLIDGDTSHISKTIIDGSQYTNVWKASVVIIMNVPGSSLVLSGFNITGGAGYYYSGTSGTYGGGIFLMNCGGTIKNNIIEKNRIEAGNAAFPAIAAIPGESDTLFISNNIIRDNEVVSGYMVGGAVTINANFYAHMVVYFHDNVISNNIATSTILYKAIGGGLEIETTYANDADIRVYNNVIEHNELHCRSSFGAGIYVVYEKTHVTPLSNKTQVKIYNNVIADNYSSDKGGGIGIWNMAKHFEEYKYLDYPPDPVMINNTITGNIASDGAGIFNYDATAVLINNILWDSLTGPDCREIFQDSLTEYAFPTTPRTPVEPNLGILHLYNNCIQGGWEPGMEEEWEGTWLGTDNIDADPLLIPGTFELSDSSPCIGTGIDSVEVGGSWFKAPPYDFYGNPRPNPVDEFVDIGAIESPFPTDIAVHYEPERTRVYPNPFNESITIESGDRIQHIDLVDISGKVLRSYDNINGNQAEIERGGLSSGLYFLRIEAGWIEVRKVVVR